mmetsp:Transcript_19479/g.44194  ORF Transcript_19479/g.44194 Transcript_19479/m.44194 type:complete len:241 (+) Transcript_19479:390-1112(+)
MATFPEPAEEGPRRCFRESCLRSWTPNPIPRWGGTRRERRSRFWTWRSSRPVPCSSTSATKSTRPSSASSTCTGSERSPKARTAARTRTSPSSGTGPRFLRTSAGCHKAWPTHISASRPRPGTSSFSRRAAPRGALPRAPCPRHRPLPGPRRRWATALRCAPRPPEFATRSRRSASQTRSGSPASTASLISPNPSRRDPASATSRARTATARVGLWICQQASGTSSSSTSKRAKPTRRRP